MNLSPSELFQTHVKNLKKVGSQGQYVGLCPFHNDRNPSLSVNIPSTLWNCHAGCGGGDAADFAEMLNLDPKPYYKNGHKPPQIRIEKDPYIPLSEKDVEKARYYVKYLQNNWKEINTPAPWTKAACKFYTGYDPETKRFVFIHTNKDGIPVNIKWHKDSNGKAGYSIPNHGGCRWYPLGLIDGYEPDKVLVICEGEKDADTLISNEIQALTGTTGAGSVPKDLSNLKPFKKIIVCYDDDTKGDTGSSDMATAIKKKYSYNGVRLFRWDMLNPKKGYDITDYFSEGHTADDFKTLLRTNSKTVPEADLDENREFPDIRVFSLNDMLKDETKPPPGIISHGVLPQNGILLLHGSPKAGKSILACNLALSIASGQNWFDFRIENPRKTLIVQAEVNYFPLRDRLKTMLIIDEYSKSKDYVHSTEAKGFDILSEEGIFHIQRWIIGYEPEVIIFDPLKDYHYKDENSNTDMAVVMQKFREIVEKNNISLIIVHHSKKYNDSGSGDNVRGASNIFGSVDAAIELKKKKEGYRKLKFDLRYGKQPDDFDLYLNETTLFFEMVDSKSKNENESALIEIVKASEPDGISKTELKKKWRKKTNKSESMFYTTFNNCEDQLQKEGKKFHILGNVLPL